MRDYHPGDEKELNNLFNLVFNKNRPLNEWHWQYRDNPVSSANIISVAEDNRKIVGQHANVVVHFKYKDKKIFVGQPVDILLNPNYRGIKIVKDTWKLSYDMYFKKSIYFGIGFPNEIYYPVGKRLCKYEDLGIISTLHKRLKLHLSSRTRFPTFPMFLQSGVQRISGEVYKFGIILNSLKKQKLSIQKLSEFNSEIDILWERAKDRYEIMATRDYNFLKWRYMDKSDRPYDIFLVKDNLPLGYVVAKIARRGHHLVGYIVDIFSLNPKVDNLLIGATLKYFILNGVDYSLCRILKEDTVYNTLLDYGFKEREAFHGTPVTYQIFNDEIDLSFFKERRNWHLTYGDQIDVEC